MLHLIVDRCLARWHVVPVEGLKRITEANSYSWLTFTPPHRVAMHIMETLVSSKSLACMPPHAHVVPVQEACNVSRKLTATCS